MKVLVAKNAGFCMGVRRAVETTLETIHREKKGVSTFGPLIHNPQVLDLLEERGIRVLKNIPARETGSVIIRAHGIPPAQKKQLQDSGAKVKDATCPRVVKVQAIIRKYTSQGWGTIIIGDKNHAEVEGLMGYAAPLGIVVSNEEDVAGLHEAPRQLTTPYIIVSQTTQDEAAFERLSRMIMDRIPGGTVFNTICGSTHRRQDEVRELATKVDAMVVVGGKNSANTLRLAQIAEGMGCTVFLLETEKELDTAALAKFDRVGVTAGASTPTWMINRVVRTLESIPSRGEGVVRPLLFRILWLLLATNLYVGLGGGFLAYACDLLQGIEPQFNHLLIGFGYIFAVHNFNRFTDEKTGKFGDPIRGLFYQRYRWPLLLVSAMALVMALTLAYGLGANSFYLLAGMSLFGILYSVHFIPGFLLPIIKVRGLKEIPGSKTFFVAVAWAFITTLVPAWGESRWPGTATLGVLVFVLMLIYVRSALFDVFDVQADRLVGKETLPVFIGEKRTLFFLHLIMGLLILWLLVLPGLGLLPPAAFWLIPGVLYLIGLSVLYEKGHIRPGPKLDFYLESLLFIIAGFAWFGYELTGTF